MQLVEAKGNNSLVVDLVRGIQHVQEVLRIAEALIGRCCIAPTGSVVSQCSNSGNLACMWCIVSECSHSFPRSQNLTFSLIRHESRQCSRPIQLTYTKYDTPVLMPFNRSG